ncbi:hypothetical protein BDFG_03817 [Blastomyces dermatitidis ATCC 26199]|nr:hypothetical protein BDFG_03817 [Blastomyces dermatitidis ATCC 26199]
MAQLIIIMVKWRALGGWSRYHTLTPQALIRLVCPAALSLPDFARVHSTSGSFTRALHRITFAHHPATHATTRPFGAEQAMTDGPAVRPASQAYSLHGWINPFRLPEPNALDVHIRCGAA